MSKQEELREIVKDILRNPNEDVSKEKKALIQRMAQTPEELVRIILESNDIPPNLSSSLSSLELLDEERLANSYVKLAIAAIKRQGLKEVTGLKVKEAKNTFKTYAMTSKPVLLDLKGIATSKNPENYELLQKIESEQADLFLEDSMEESRQKVIHKIESIKINGNF